MMAKSQAKTEEGTSNIKKNILMLSEENINIFAERINNA